MGIRNIYFRVRSSDARKASSPDVGAKEPKKKGRFIEA